MTSLALTQRRRTGTALIAVGALLLTMSAVMIVGLAPDAEAQTASTPVSNGGVTPYIIDGANEGGNRTCLEAGGYDNSATWPSLSGASSGNIAGPITWSTDGTYVTWSVDADDHDGIAFIVKGGNAANVYWYLGDATGDSGLASPPTGGGGGPAGLSNLNVCWNDPDTTTTTPTTSATTTTLAAPTTLPATSTTQQAGPGEQLPDTGPGELLALMAGGLGFTLIGSGTLVIASNRRRSL